MRRRFFVAAGSSLLVPALALAAPKPSKPAPRRTANAAPAASANRGECLKPAIEIVASDTERFALARCDGSPVPLAVEQLSILMRPGGTPKPMQPLAQLAKTKGDMLATNIRRIDAGLVVRLQKVVDHFSKPSRTTRVFVVSGYRPASRGSKHSEARALDFKIDGVTNEDLVAFCKTLDDTGCGYYPNSTFVHMDVRDPGAGHVSWIDASGPGEAPRYVATWPPRATTPPPPPPAFDDHPEKADDPDSLPALPMPDESAH